MTTHEHLKIATFLVYILDKKFKIFRQFNADGLEIDDLQDEDTEEAVDEAPSTDAIILRISSLQHTFNFN